MKIRTDYIHPAIPYRGFDWVATDDATYGGDPADPIGHGETEAAAIADLIAQIEDAYEASDAHSNLYGRN